MRASCQKAGISIESGAQSIFKRSMPLAKAGVGTGSREENAKKKERSIFKRSMPLAKAEVGTGSRQENAISHRNIERSISFIQNEFRSRA
jgi:hypothetical protein